MKMNSIRSMCMFSDIRTTDNVDGCRRLRLTLHEQNQNHQQQPITRKPVGRAFAVVQPPSERQPPSEKQPLKTEPVKAEENVEVIKVYLKAQKQEQDRTKQSLKMLSDEVSQIQEVRYCLKSLREQMAAKSHHRSEHKLQLVRNGLSKSSCSLSSVGSMDDLDDNQDGVDEQERARMREVSKRLYNQLQEAERRHQDEKEILQAEAGQYKRQLSEQSDQLREAQLNAQQQDQRITEMQRLMGGMEQESTTLRDELRSREMELMRLRGVQVEGADNDRLEELEKDNAILKEKIFHLDDMLKSQQRKLRQMIEQLQNSKMLIQERDRVIRELEEKVAFLEAENREMRDQIDYYLENQTSNLKPPPESNAQIVYSKPLKPSTQGNKSLPFIKVIEIKS